MSDVDDSAGARVGPQVRGDLPYTAATLPEQLAAIDGLARQHADVRWALLLDLIWPQTRLHHVTHEPVVRLSWRTDIVPLTPEKTGAAVDAVTDRILAVLGDHPGRWRDVLRMVRDISARPRDRLLHELAVADLDALSGDERVDLWRKLGHVMRFERRYTGSPESVSEDLVQALASCATRIEPRDDPRRHSCDRLRTPGDSPEVWGVHR